MGINPIAVNGRSTSDSFLLPRGEGKGEGLLNRRYAVTAP
jgi:hypothetical protein